MSRQTGIIDNADIMSTLDGRYIFRVPLHEPRHSKNVVEVGSVVERVGNKYIARRQYDMKQLHGLHFDFATDAEIAVWRKHCHLAK